MILTYELTDDIGVEHEVEVESIEAAVETLISLTDYTVWWSLTDENGDEISCSIPF